MKPNYFKLALMHDWDISNYFKSYYSLFDNHALHTLKRYLEDETRRPRKPYVPYLRYKILAIDYVLSSIITNDYLPF